MPRKKAGRGGARPGGGRPRLDEQTALIRVPESLAEPIKSNIDKIRDFLGVPMPVKDDPGTQLD